MKAYITPPNLTTLFARVSSFNSGKPDVSWPEGYKTTSLDLATLDNGTSDNYRLLDQSLEPPYTKIKLDYPTSPTDDLMAALCRFYVLGGQQHECAIPQTLMEWVPSPSNVWVADSDLEIQFTSGTAPVSESLGSNLVVSKDYFDKFYNGQDPYPSVQGRISVGLTQLSALPLDTSKSSCKALGTINDALVRSGGLGYPGGLVRAGSSFSVDLIWSDLEVGRSSTTKTNLINLNTGTLVFTAPSPILHVFSYFNKMWVVTTTGVYAATGEPNTLVSKPITAVGTFDNTFAICEANRNISIWEGGSFSSVAQVPAGRTALKVISIGGTAYLINYSGVVVYVTDLVSGLDVGTSVFPGGVTGADLIDCGYSQLGYYLRFISGFALNVFKTRKGLDISVVSGGTLSVSGQSGRVSSTTVTGLVSHAIQPFYRIDSVLLKSTFQFTHFSVNTGIPAPIIKEKGTTNTALFPAGITVITDTFDFGMVLRGDGWYLTYPSAGVTKLKYLAPLSTFSSGANEFEVVLNTLPSPTAAFAKNLESVYPKSDVTNSAIDRRVYPAVGGIGQKSNTTCLTYSSWDVPMYVNIGTDTERVLPSAVGTFPMTSIDSMDRLTTPESDSLGFQVWTQDDGDNPNELWTTGAIPSPTITFRTLGRADVWSFMPTSTYNILATVFRGYTQILDKEKESVAGQGLRPKITVNVVDWKEQLSENINLTTQYFCPHLFGSTACGVNSSEVTGRILVGTVQAYSSRQIQIKLDTPPGISNTFKLEDYDAFKIKIIDGILAGSEYSGRTVTTTATVTGTAGVYNTGGTITVNGYFDLPFTQSRLINSCVVIFPDCRKTYKDCTKYNNTRYAGFFAVPGASRAFQAGSALPTTDQLTAANSFLY